NFLDSGRRKLDRGSGDSGIRQKLEAQAEPEWDLAASWDQEYEKNLAALAMRRGQQEGPPAPRHAVWGNPAGGEGRRDVARALGMTPGAVYVARSRVMARLKDEVQRMQEEE